MVQFERSLPSLGFSPLLFGCHGQQKPRPSFRMRISPGLQYRHEFIHYSRTWGGAYSEPCVEQKSGRVFRKETKGLCPGARHAARRWRQRRAEAPCIPVAALQARAATTVVIPACGAAVPHCAWGFARVLIGH